MGSVLNETEGEVAQRGIANPLCEFHSLSGDRGHGDLRVLGVVKARKIRNNSCGNKYRLQGRMALIYMLLGEPMTALLQYKVQALLHLG